MLADVLSVVEHGLLLDRRLDLLLHIQAERLRLEKHTLAIGVALRFHVSLASLMDEPCEPVQVIQNSRRRLRVPSAKVGTA